MSHLKLRRELEPRLLAQLTANYPDVNIDWENADFTNPEDEDVLVAPIMVTGRSRVSSVGRKSVRSIGVFQIDVLAPKDIGTGILEEICEFIAKYFSAKQYNLPGENSYATMGEGSIKNIGQRMGKYRKVVSVPYTINAIKL